MDFSAYFKALKNGQLEAINVFTGPERYNIDHTIKYIEGNFLNPAYQTFNFTLIDGALDVSALTELVMTLPFLDERRLVVIQKTGVLKQLKEDQEEKMLTLLNQIPDHLVLIFNEQDIDQRKKVCKLLKKEATWVNFPKLTRPDFVKWCQRKMGERANPHVINYLIDRVDYLDEASDKNLYDVDNVIKSLVGRNEPITEQMINQYVKIPVEHNVFKMMDAMSEKNMGLAIKILSDFIQSGEAPIKIFALMTLQYRNIYKLKKLLKSGYTSKTAAAKLDIHPFVAQKASHFALKYEEKELEQIMAVLYETDMGLKSTGLPAQWLIEKALFQIQQFAK